MKAALKTNDAPYAETVTITPADAKEWLHNSRFENRRLDDRIVNKIRRDIKKGKWLFDGSPIRFDRDGNVLDGQHRLQAIINAGTAVESVVVRDLPKEAINTIDTGKSRSVADILHFGGHINASLLASACRLSIGYREFHGDLKKWVDSRARERLSTQEVLAEANNNPKLVEAVQNMVSRPSCGKMMGGGVASVAFMLFHRIDKYHAEVFFHAFDKGVGLELGSPILALRNTLLFRTYGEYKKNGNQAIVSKMAITIKAWNLYRKGKNIERLTYSPDKEEYPTPQ